MTDICVETYDSSSLTLFVTGIGPVLGPLKTSKNAQIVRVNSNSFIEIATRCFKGYLNLKEIFLPDSIEIINDNIIENTNLVNITLPKNVKTLSISQPFDWCYSLQNIIVSKQNNYFCDLDGCLFSKDQKILYFVPGGKSQETYFVPASVQTINVAAFCHSKILKTIVIPPSVKKVGSCFGWSSDALLSVIVNQCKTLIDFDKTSAFRNTEHESDPDAIIHYSPYCLHQKTCFYNSHIQIITLHHLIIFLLL